MVVKTFNPDGIPTVPTYHQVAVTDVSQGKLITLAGQVGRNPESGAALPSFEEQVDQAYLNVVTALTASGATLKDIVHVRHYVVVHTGNAQLDGKDVVDRGWGEKWMELMDSQADGHRPPDTVLGVAALAKKGLLYEVECWAFVPA